MVELLNIDCMTYMATLEDNAFDLAIVDPPYGIGNWVQQDDGGNARGDAVTWNDSIPSDEYFKELVRVSKHRIIWGANYYGRIDGRGGAIVWNKRVKRESNLSVCEIASYDRVARVDYVDLIWQNVNRGEVMIHPCQKPVKLYQWLLDNYSEPGQRILDTHLGSGSSAIAAHYFGVDFVGCELDQDYYEAACNRFDHETKQQAMF
jgi:site-specific DNA-methyltransferase (adenine-specific)